MNETQTIIVDLLDNHGPMTTEQLIAVTGLDRSTIRYNAARLAEDGVLAAEGISGSESRMQWRLSAIDLYSKRVSARVANAMKTARYGEWVR